MTEHALRFALLGDPVDHSLSPVIHEAALEAVGLSGTYEARRCAVEGVVLACEELRARVLDGFNVTMPLKSAALEAVDELSAIAERAGAINTVRLSGTSVVGENTDVGGIRDTWRRRGLPEDGPILILGSGGAAAAALLALEGSELLLSSRRVDARAALVERLGVDVSEHPWGRGVRGAVVVNATPLGMRGEDLPGEVLVDAAGVFDMAYRPSPTPAVVAAGDRPVADGIDMLVSQAARSFHLWTGVAVPIEVMEEAARG